MGSKLQQEIKQTVPFSSLEQEAILNLRRTDGALAYPVQHMLKEHGLTSAQYNVLRILRGAGKEGLRCSEIGERLIHHDPDITRLLSRLQLQKLVEQRRDPRDRRAIYTRISAAGLRQLKQLDPLVERATKSMLSHMKPARLTLLIKLLEEMRQAG